MKYQFVDSSAMKEYLADWTNTGKGTIYRLNNDKEKILAELLHVFVHVLDNIFVLF